MSSLAGDIRFHEHVHSPQLDNERTVAVYLPPDYETGPARSYPVLYMHDGNNLFDDRTSFSGVEWRVDETAQELITAGRMAPVIIVGIYNNADRSDEYTVHADKEFGGGRGERYLDFVVRTVKPLIEKTYRVLPGRANTTIAGSSLGGIISMYAGVRYPEIFGGVGVLSPAVYWGGRAILREIRSGRFRKPIRIWLDAGTAEVVLRGERNTFEGLVKDCRKFASALRSRGLVPGKDFVYKEYEGAGHHESDWAARFGDVLEFFYGVTEKSGVTGRNQSPRGRSSMSRSRE